MHTHEDKASTSTNLTNASSTDDVIDFELRRKEDALALAQLAYDIFIDQESGTEEAEGRNNAKLQAD